MGIARQFSTAARHLGEHLVRILKPPGKRLPDAWLRRLAQMKQCRSPRQLVAEFGEPDHKVPHGDLEIWHYPLGVARGLNYSIHVLASPSELNQVFLYFE